MGFNFESAGFANVDDMFIALIENEDAQVLVMASFIKSNSLAGAMQKEKWDVFARGYNGPKFKYND